jgi:hypothetical protein
MGEKAELKRGFWRRKEFRFVDPRASPDDLGVADSAMFDSFELHNL